MVHSWYSSGGGAAGRALTRGSNRAGSNNRCRGMNALRRIQRRGDLLDRILRIAAGREVGYSPRPSLRAIPADALLLLRRRGRPQRRQVAQELLGLGEQVLRLAVVLENQLRL